MEIFSIKKSKNDHFLKSEQDSGVKLKYTGVKFEYIKVLQYARLEK